VRAHPGHPSSPIDLSRLSARARPRSSGQRRGGIPLPEPLGGGLRGLSGDVRGGLRRGGGLGHDD
jgi:hypothetical protein